MTCNACESLKELLSKAVTKGTLLVQRDVHALAVLQQLRPQGWQAKASAAVQTWSAAIVCAVHMLVLLLLLKGMSVDRRR